MGYRGVAVRCGDEEEDDLGEKAFSNRQVIYFILDIALG
jgi:hypothetical protein